MEDCNKRSGMHLGPVDTGAEETKQRRRPLSATATATATASFPTTPYYNEDSEIEEEEEEEDYDDIGTTIITQTTTIDVATSSCYS
ncbi:hypothetical protein AK812_SmicGene5363 [Symbiodinium microadriaticum]|uniref:Uncharacterized protein n=1 Tax=Symbiodinium microadriaticum TaxID=2951 RepID=A0A1Q9EU03_SYMMI|nr:hypothetical protein AK812_SmicGene5363 [Symbiodinium microadriaticum]